MSVVKFGIVANFKEIDETAGRLMAAMRPGNLHQVGANRAYQQVKGKYRKRFASQVNKQSQWQQWKSKAFGTSEPGFLTGTTYDSITPDFGEQEARVFLEGVWPKGNQQLVNVTDKGGVSTCVKWGEGGDFEFSGFYLSSQRGPGPWYVPSEKMENKFYGQRDIDTRRKGKEIKFMFLDDEDISLVLGDMDKVLQGGINGDKSFAPIGGEVTPGVRIKDIDIPVEPEEPVTLEEVQSEIGVDPEQYLQPLYASGVSEKVIERERRKIMEFLKRQK